VQEYSKEASKFPFSSVLFSLYKGSKQLKWQNVWQLLAMMDEKDFLKIWTTNIQ